MNRHPTNKGRDAIRRKLKQDLAPTPPPDPLAMTAPMDATIPERPKVLRAENNAYYSHRHPNRLASSYAERE
jgi:hypothetical protein